MDPSGFCVNVESTMPNRETPVAKPMKQACNPLAPLPPLGMDAEAIGFDFRRYFAHTLGRDDHCTSSHYPYKALALAVRDRLIERWEKHPFHLRGRGLQADILPFAGISHGAYPEQRHPQS